MGLLDSAWIALRRTTQTASMACLWVGLHHSATAQMPEVCAESPPQVPAELASKKPPMQYCFSNEGTLPVLWLYGAIGLNTFDHVSSGLRQTHRYREVWLNSDGGYVHEGYKIGNEFMRLRATVRVPKSARVRCVSACTMLMLGGYNRTVDLGATFMIHAPSSVLGISEDGRFSNQRTWGDVLRHVKDEPRHLTQFIEPRRARERQNSADYVIYLQSVLGGSPNTPLYNELAQMPLPLVYGDDASDRSVERDFGALRANGIVAFQELLTQVELESMRLMLSRMRDRQANLGRGARVAIRIFEANLACRIQDVCLLSRHQLASLGYHNFDRE